MADGGSESWAERRPYLAFGLFWLIACLFTWSFFALPRGPAVNADSFAGLLSHPVRLLPKFGPTLAGLVLPATGGPTIRARFMAALRSANPVLVALAVLVPGALTAGGLALAAAMSGLDPRLVLTGFSLAGIAYWIALRSLLGGGMGEEPGLRGVALPLLLSRMGPRRAGVVMGVFWAAWHIPILWGRPPLTWLAQLALTLSASLILTFVWVRLRPSLGVAILFHGALNGWDHFASVAWAPQLATHSAWEVFRLVALLAVALLLLPLNWTRTDPPMEMVHAQA